MTGVQTCALPIYKHGIDTKRDSDISISTTKATTVQVAVGTAPVNLLDDPKSAVNKPVLVSNKDDVRKSLGVCTNYGSYTLMQTTLASLQKTGVAPVVMINVLDPAKPSHVTAVAGKEFDVAKGTATITEEGIQIGRASCRERV